MDTSGLPSDVTRLLQKWSRGDAEALPRLLEQVYDELRIVARNHLRRERRSHTLDPTGLVHEAYLRLAEQRRAEWLNRHQFFAVASSLMRRILVDHARARRTRKRKGLHVTLHDWHAVAGSAHVDILGLDVALSRLEAGFPREARVVELRYFCGMSLEETAAALGINISTVKRDWTFARAWLLRELEGAITPDA